MPSLHTAYAVIIGCAGVLVFSHVLLKVVWVLYPGLVVFSIIATANHWFLDATIGAFVALFALVFAFALSRGTVPTLGARAGRRTPDTPTAYPPRTADALPQRA
jgi:membrane-associated phospholipid phosphatase